MSEMTVKGTGKISSREGFSPNEPLSLVTVCLDSETWGLLKRFAEAAPLLQLRMNLEDYRIEDHESVAEWIGDPPPDVCLIDFDKDRRRAAMVAERIRDTAPETTIFAISSQAQPDLIIQAMRSGCGEYLVKPIDREQLLSALARVGGRKKEKKEHYTAQVLAFIGAKGGCGVTTLVTQLGALLANSYSRKTLVVDLHPDFGDAALYLGLTKYRYHSFELLENTDRLDAELLHSFVMHHSSGLDVIPAPEGTEPTRQVMPGALARTFDFLRLRYEFILVDLPPGLNEENLELIRYCDHLYVVTVAEVSALRNVVRHIDYFTHKVIPQEKMRVVLNRHQKRGLISDGQIEKVTRQRIFWKVPNQYVHVVKTISEGDPVSQLSSSDVARNLEEWAGAIGRKPGSEDKKKDSRGILGLWNR
jgi:pilus assembly protein CpaE